MKEKPYDKTIIFMDIYMPEMDGFQATEIIMNMKKKKSNKLAFNPNYL